MKSDILKELKQKIGYEETPEHKIKAVKIIKDQRQFSIRIPKKISELMQINEKKDNFEFHLIPQENGSLKLEGVLIKG
ncbi:hypothetical protein HOK51_03800 [Candidatus Woesearchaeota archaeon]|jgi:hypothetical protein|nr:hypothetical protein [Candidatus Woesearchaeota archaeon]MBT6518946.1 hypothetical protein [Candidatus Woesearchaeota archaeon]MBT7368311.1 hypothetical protein [Candidatus Woesearchaeota archaeon]